MVRASAATSPPGLCIPRVWASAAADTSSVKSSAGILPSNFSGSSKSRRDAGVTKPLRKLIQWDPRVRKFAKKSGLATFCQRAIQKFDHVHDLLSRGMDFRSRAHLQQAPWICSDDDGSIGCARVFHFLCKEIERRLRLGDVVGACRSAAVIRHSHFDQLHIGDGAQELPGSFTNFLAVQQVAGILIRNAQRYAVERSAQSQFGEKFRSIAHFFSECMRLGMIVGAFRKKFLVFLEGRTASGGVSNYGVKIFTQENVEINVGE